MNYVIRLTELQFASLRRARKLYNLLTPAERRVAEIATLGCTNKEIANLLGNSSKTIERHIESITNKARLVYGKSTSFRGTVVLELHCYYFLTNEGNAIDEQKLIGCDHKQ